MQPIERKRGRYLGHSGNRVSLRWVRVCPHSEAVRKM